MIIFKINNLLEIFLTYKNSQLCSEVVNIPPRKDIAYKRTRVFTLNLQNLLACKSSKQFVTRDTTRQTVLSHDVMGDTWCMMFVQTFVEEYRLFCNIEFFLAVVGKRKTIQEAYTYCVNVIILLVENSFCRSDTYRRSKHI